jgi:hypothetical protein
MKIKNARFILKIKKQFNKLFCKQTYQDFYEDILGIGSTSIEDVIRVEESKQKKKKTAVKNV